MRIVADESVDQQIVDRLREQGNDVVSVAEQAPGIEDEKVLGLSRDENAVLLTADKDFGQLVFQQGLIYCGIVLIRLAGLAPAAKAELVATVFDRHGEELTAGFAVLTERSLRIRRQGR